MSIPCNVLILFVERPLVLIPTLSTWSFDFDLLGVLSDNISESAVLNIIIQTFIQVLNHHRLIFILTLSALNFDRTSSV